MKLASPAFERELRRRVRRELKSSKELWKEYRRTRRSRPRNVRTEPLLRLVLPVILGGIALAAPMGVPLVLLALTLYGAGTCLLRAHGLLVGLHGSRDLNVLVHFPLADDELLRLQWKKFHRSSLWFLYTCLALYLGLALAHRPGALAAAAAAGLALVHWAGMLGMAAALAAWRPAWPLGAAGKAFCAAAGLLCLFSQAVGPLLPAQSGLGLLAVPTGWTSYALRSGILDGRPWALFAALPVAALAALFPLAGRRLLGTYVVGELVYQAPPPAELILESAVERELVRQSEYNPELVDRPELKPLVRDELLRSIPDALERSILDGALRRPPEWASGGPLERAFAALLSPRGQALADFLLGGNPGWSRSWLRSAAIAGIGAGFALLTAATPLWLILGPFLLAVLPLLGGRWNGFQSLPIGGAYMPHCAIYPMSYWEMSSILFRASLLRLLAWTPLLLGLLVAAASDLRLSTGAALLLGLKGLLVGVAAIPVSNLFRFSAGTNDTLRLGCLRILFVGALGLGILGSVGCGFLLFVPDAGAPRAAGAAGLVALSLGTWALYGLVYQRGRIDLLRSTPPS